VQGLENFLKPDQSLLSDEKEESFAKNKPVNEALLPLDFPELLNEQKSL